MRPQFCLLFPLGEGPVDPGFGRPGGGGPVDPGWGVTPPTDPGYGRPGWGPVDPGFGVGSGLHPGHGLPSGGHVGGGPMPPVVGTKPIQPPPAGSPPVSIWPPPPAIWPPAEGGDTIENPIVIPPPPEGTVILVWVSGVGYRYVTIGAAPK